MLEEWEYHAGNRLKSVIIVGLVLLVVVQFAEGKYEEGRIMQANSENVVIEGVLTEGTAENSLTDETLLQTQLEQAETDFHETVEQLATNNSWSAQYTEEAERYYQQYAEAMSWALVYYQGAQTDELWKEDLIRKKAVQMEALFREQSDSINNYLKLRKE